MKLQQAAVRPSPPFPQAPPNPILVASKADRPDSDLGRPFPLAALVLGLVNGNHLHTAGTNYYDYCLSGVQFLLQEEGWRRRPHETLRFSPMPISAGVKHCRRATCCLPTVGWTSRPVPLPLPLSNATAYRKPPGMPFRSVDEMFMCSTYSARDWQSKPTFHILLFLLCPKQVGLHLR